MSILSNKNIILTVVLFIVYGCLFYTSAYSQRNEPLQIVSADSMNNNSIYGELRRTYSGNVHFIQGKTHVFCDRGVFFLNQNKANLIGSVRILEDDMSLEAPSMDYDGNTRIANAFGGVKVSDSSTVLTANRGTYHMNEHTAFFNGNVLVVDDSVTIVCDKIIHKRKEGYSRAVGNAFVKGKFTNVLIAGDTLSNDKKKNYSLAKGNPILIQIDSTVSSGLIQYDTLTIESAVMEAHRDQGNEKYIFTDSVSIIRNNVKAKAGNSTFWKDLEIISLYKDPVVWHDSTQLHADSISIFMKDNKLQKLVARSNSIACMKDNPEYNPDYINQISGYRIDIIITDNEISQLNGFDDAKSLYFMVSEQGGEVTSLSVADTINITFKDNNPENIIWLGQVDGEVIPDPVVYPKPQDYYLPNFKWDNYQPKKRELELPAIFKKE